MTKVMESDVVVIGSGIGGASIARELSRYKVDVLLIDKSDSIPEGQSKAGQMTLYRGLMNLTSHVAKSFILKAGQPLYNPKSRRTREEDESWEIWHKEWLPQLSIPYRKAGVLVLATKDRLQALSLMWNMALESGGIYADGEKVDRDFILNKEPSVNKDVVAGLWAKGHHVTIVDPWEQTMALVENAQQNGVRVLRGAKVISITFKDGIHHVETTKGHLKSKFVVNSAGIYADRIARMVGPIGWAMTPQAGGGASLITDKEASAELATGENVIIFAPDPAYLEAVSPTFSGNLYFNCGKYKAIENREGVSVSREELQFSLSIAKRLIPSLSERHIIRFFTAVRAYHTGDPEEHVIGPHPANPRFINAAFRLPAFNSAPSVATHEIPQLLADAGLEMTTKSNFNPYRKGIPRVRVLADDEKNKLIAQDSKYGHIVCRCEHAAEGEIVEAIRRGARTVQDVKFMTRAGMGRCQGGFCEPRVIQILSRELDISATQVVMRSSDSPIVFCKGKELLRSGL
jgi:glycerol-3-phosphate dehydrogenase